MSARALRDIRRNGTYRRDLVLPSQTLLEEYRYILVHIDAYDEMNGCRTRIINWTEYVDDDLTLFELLGKLLRLKYALEPIQNLLYTECIDGFATGGGTVPYPKWIPFSLNRVFDFRAKIFRLRCKLDEALNVLKPDRPR